MNRRFCVSHVYPVVATCCVLAGLSPVRGETGEGFRPDRAMFDRLDRAINGGDGFKTGLGGKLAWGESYVLQAYVEMYRATGDTYYLDKLVDHADHVLASRDDRRGVRDYSGRSRPAWSVGEQYTVAELAFKDGDGKDILRFRSTKYAYNDRTKIAIKPRPDTGLFDLSIENEYWKAREQYEGLSMDRNSPACVERVVNHCDWVATERKVLCGPTGSALVTVEILGNPSGPPVNNSEGTPLSDRPVAMIPLRMAFHGYSGLMTFPMLEFARIVRHGPALDEKYAAIADRYVAEAITVHRDAEEEWRDGPLEGEGYYVNGGRGCPFWSDNIGKAFNYQGAQGRALVRLAQLTGDPHWEWRARSIARLFKRHLRAAENGCYVWNYWWGLAEQGWTRENSPSFNTPAYKGYTTVEDISHGTLDVDFACVCAEAEWVFDAADMHRFAATFLKNVVDRSEWTTSRRVDGSGGLGEHDANIGGWCGLAAWEPEVARAALRICERQKVHERQSGSAMRTLATLIRWSKELGNATSQGATSQPASETAPALP